MHGNFVSCKKTLPSSQKRSEDNMSHSLYDILNEITDTLPTMIKSLREVVLTVYFTCVFSWKNPKISPKICSLFFITCEIFYSQVP